MPALIGALLVPKIGHAEDCAAPGEPYVQVVTPSSDRELGKRVTEQLRASLRSRNIDVCDVTGGAAPIAKIVLEPTCAPNDSGRPECVASRVVITVEIADAITNKRVARDVDLSNVPRDTWPLTLALASDEILRASWAELALVNAPKPKREVPPQVRRTVRESIEPVPEEKSVRAEVSAGFVLELYAAGQRQIGVDAQGAFWPTRRLFVHALAGIRSAADVESEHGTIRSRALVFGLGPGLALTRPDARIGTDAIARVKWIHALFEADPGASARSRSGSLDAIYAEAGLDFWFAPEPSLRLGLELAGGAPIRAANALDDSSVSTGYDGGSLAATLSFGGVF